MNKLSQIPEDLLRQILAEDRLRQRTLREMSNSLDRVEEQRKLVDGVKCDITIVMACLRRLGLSDSDILNCLRRAFEKDDSQWLSYLYPYLKLFGRVKGSITRISHSSGAAKNYSFHEDADGVYVYVSDYPYSSGVLSIDDIHKEVLSLVIK